MSCVPGPPVVFDFATWIMRYPEFATVPSNLAQLYFDEATLYCNNSPLGAVPSPSPRTQFLNMLTAHIAAMNAAINGQPASPLVGRISSASEGSVSVSTENQYPPGTPQWFQQTKYGAAFWQASAQFRTARYVTGFPQNVPQAPYPPYPYGGYGGGGGGQGGY